MSEIKNLLDELNMNIEVTYERIREFEDRSTESTQPEKERLKN